MARETIDASGGTYFLSSGRDTKAGQAPKRKVFARARVYFAHVMAKSFLEGLDALEGFSCTRSQLVGP